MLLHFELYRIIPHPLPPLLHAITIKKTKHYRYSMILQLYSLQLEKNHWSRWIEVFNNEDLKKRSRVYDWPMKRWFHWESNSRIAEKRFLQFLRILKSFAHWSSVLIRLLRSFVVIALFVCARTHTKKCKIYKLRLHILNNGGQKISLFICAFCRPRFAHRV